MFICINGFRAGSAAFMAKGETRIRATAGQRRRAGQKDRDSWRGSLSGAGFQPVSLTSWKDCPTEENDRAGTQPDPNCYYIRQLPISYPASEGKPRQGNHLSSAVLRA